jgi:hypothetical protein
MRVGDSFYLEIQYDESTDITGFTHTFTMRENFDEPPALQVVSTVGDDPADLIVERKAIIRVPPAMTALLAPGKYVWDIQAEVPATVSHGADIMTLAPDPDDFKDRIRVVPEVTVAED